VKFKTNAEYARDQEGRRGAEKKPDGFVAANSARTEAHENLSTVERRLSLALIVGSVLVLIFCVFIFKIAHRLGRQSQQPKIELLEQSNDQAQHKAVEATKNLATCQIDLSNEQLEERSMHGKMLTLETAFEKDRRWHEQDERFWEKYGRRIVILDADSGAGAQGGQDLRHSQ
jgi:hypothetical protein